MMGMGEGKTMGTSSLLVNFIFYLKRRFKASYKGFTIVLGDGWIYGLWYSLSFSVLLNSSPKLERHSHIFLIVNCDTFI